MPISLSLSQRGSFSLQIHSRQLILDRDLGSSDGLLTHTEREFFSESVEEPRTAPPTPQKATPEKIEKEDPLIEVRCHGQSWALPRGIETEMAEMARNGWMARDGEGRRPCVFFLGELRVSTQVEVPYVSQFPPPTEEETLMLACPPYGTLDPTL